MLPRSKLIDPNRWIYRFGHTLSMNDCLYSSFAKYVALVDIDEFIIPNSGTLLPFLRKMHDLNDTAGSFVFEHARANPVIALFLVYTAPFGGCHSDIKILDDGGKCKE
ncbi:unnamed protein product [Wuchereria bancrofti]|uniref:Glycosyltransferase family 92 protein n=1 Tax=Wuchereria bancrofti TaxID=6293 RepID=A0A3P7DWQ0_WUCBA|nr:unnamed protein product [Wuchereria bancrofti]